MRALPSHVQFKVKPEPYLLLPPMSSQPSDGGALLVLPTTAIERLPQFPRRLVLLRGVSLLHCGPVHLPVSTGIHRYIC
jgi:hypothetical protein